MLCLLSHSHTQTHCIVSISGSRSIQTHSKGLIINITLLLLLSARWNTVNYTSNTNYYQITTITMKKKLRNKYKMDLNTLNCLFTERKWQMANGIAFVMSFVYIFRIMWATATRTITWYKTGNGASGTRSLWRFSSSFSEMGRSRWRRANNAFGIYFPLQTPNCDTTHTHHRCSHKVNCCRYDSHFNLNEIIKY